MVRERQQAMNAVLTRQAARHGVRFILAGTNQATEGMRFPPGWNWNKFDRRNIVGISQRFGGPRLRTFPSISPLDYMRYVFVNRIRWISFLDLFDYKKFEALEALEREFGYKRYAYKHYESVFTRFFQGYILPHKFGVDKRKPHLSNLVVTGEMTREDALKGCQGIAYPTQKDLESDIRYFMKKMQWSEGKFNDYMSRPEKPHTDYPSEAWLYQKLIGLYRRFGLRIGKICDLVDYRKRVIPSLKPDSHLPNTFPHLFIIVDEFAARWAGCEELAGPVGA